jgi:hypothetical protein
MKALALIALERYDEAADELELAAQQVLPMGRLDDFLDVAELQACLGLPDAALATLDHLAARPQDARTYFIRFVAARAWQDDQAADAALLALIKHADEAPAQVQYALLMSGNVDAAAQLLIRRLNDPLQRQSALLELQQMHDPAWPIKELDWRAQAELLTARADVRDTVAATGGTVSDYEIYRWN